jgi:prepilin signal peptidase PulO-like enzyme (type II secretory pathway)
VTGSAPALGALVGWCLGWASSALAARLMGQEQRPGWWVVPDPLVQGLLAALGALIVVATPGPWWRWGLAGLLAVPLVLVAVTDLRERHVYTAVALAGAVAGIIGSPWLHQAAWWWGPLGAALGYLVFGGLYLAGRRLYRGQEPLATGDVTIAALVGAVAGPQVLSALVLGVLASGLAALGVLVARRSRHALMAYGPGLCLGGLLSLFLDG